MLADAIEIGASVGAVMPIDPVSRRPLVPFARATREEVGIRLLWTTFPHAAPGVLASSASLLVIDVESPKKSPDGLGPSGFATLNDLLRTVGPLPPTRKHRTKSGGVHLVYRTHARLQSAHQVIRHRELAAPGIDIVTGHACLRWPPTPGYTAANDRQIADLPDAWVRALGEAPVRRPSIHGTAEHSRSYALGALRGEANALAETSAQRNPALSRSAFRLGSLIPAITSAEIEDVLMEACRQNDSAREHGEAACRSTIRRCTKAGALHPRPARAS